MNNFEPSNCLCITGSGSTIPIAALLVHSIASKGSTNNSSTANIVNGMASQQQNLNLNKERLHQYPHPQGQHQQVASSSMLSRLPTNAQAQSSSDRLLSNNQFAHDNQQPIWYSEQGVVNASNANNQYFPSIAVAQGTLFSHKCTTYFLLIIPKY